MAEETIIGRLKRIRFQNETGWTVGVLHTKSDKVTIVGVMQGVELGALLELTGYWQEHDTFGHQFHVIAFGPPAVDSAEGLLGFLEYLPHVGPERAQYIINHFGEDKVLEVIEKSPQRLAEIPGITSERIPELIVGFAKLKESREDLVFLRGLGLKPGQCKKVREYCDKNQVGVKALFNKDPYRLTEIRGFGFDTVDGIALSFGVKAEDMCRCKAAVQHVLREARGDGDCFLPRHLLLQDVEKLSISTQRGNEAINELLKTNSIIVENQDVYDRRLHTAELAVAHHVKRLVGTSDIADEALNKYKAEELGLHELQLEGIRAALKHRFSVLTGGPGTGKTTTLKEVIELMKEAGVSMIRGCAPTGKAAMRMREQARIAALTIHRLLEWSPMVNNYQGGFMRNEYEPLYLNLLIVDESSMVDVELMQSLLCAVPDNARVMVVGDVDQLPSVGPGAVLKDMIDSGEVPVTRLTHIFRQSPNSWISQNAADIRKGIPPTLSDDSEDFFFVECDDATEVKEVIAELALDYIPEKHGVKPEDVQVLCPQKGTPVGTYELNSYLQSQWPTPKGEHWELYGPQGKFTVGVGDRVIHTMNNYELGVMNGETGIVQQFIEVERETKEAVLFDDSDFLGGKVAEPKEELKEESKEEPKSKNAAIASRIREYVDRRKQAVPAPKKKVKKMAVDFGDRLVYYGKGDARDLLLAYAITIHKSQGSEYPAVIIPVHSVNTFMLSRPLLYTGVTRGKSAVYLVGQVGALERGVENAKDTKRHTTLTKRIKEVPCPPVKKAAVLGPLENVPTQTDPTPTPS